MERARYEAKRRGIAPRYAVAAHQSDRLRGFGPGKTIIVVGAIDYSDDTLEFLRFLRRDGVTVRDDL
jgi:hypothetical protein